MRKICVITGGGSGIGFAVAKQMGRDGYDLILVGRSVKKLDNAILELKELDISAEAFACDISDRYITQRLAEHASSQGEVKAKIHAAGMSPHMGTAEQIMVANALGTVNINNASYYVLQSGSCLIDTSSISAYLKPQLLMSTRS